MRKFPIILFASGFIFYLFIPATAYAESDFLENLALGAGYHQATENNANETLVISLKTRLSRWEYGFDIGLSEAAGGGADDNFGFIWGAWIEEFQRPEWQDYGIYVGAGAGFFFLEDNLFDWPAGPFVLLGWDLSSQSGLEGKYGYFGENYWGTATFYWYFE